MMAFLYEPPDVLEAHAQWGANCGPCAFAAVVRMPVQQVRSYFVSFAKRRYVNPTHMQDALRLTGRTRLITHKTFPEYGLVFLQWEGPWTKPGVPIAAAYRHTHWLGMARDADGVMIYDCNSAGGRGQWTPLDWWQAEVAPVIMASIPRADGQYFIRTAFDIGHTNVGRDISEAQEGRG